MIVKADAAEAGRKLQEVIAHLDVDMTGVVNLDDAADPRLEKAAKKLLPEARSVVVFAMEVFDEVIDHAGPGGEAGAASLNDLFKRHSEYLNSRLTKAAYDVARDSRSMGMKALPLPAAGCPSDARFLESVFSFKHAAAAAGIGYLSRSSLLVTPEYGPRVKLACCLTAVPLESTAKTLSNMCPGCDICINNCPAGALSAPEDEPYRINKFACSAFLAASTGCFLCMRVCPAGH